ncbi:MAG: autotransporter-associated beta strand repeat-containing protein, partial [Sphingobacteriales bacterium]|nr:autotransporter-associated beta strand repeat-containing protein [Sphingobacteriales bacterium]
MHISTFVKTLMGKLFAFTKTTAYLPIPATTILQPVPAAVTHNTPQALLHTTKTTVMANFYTTRKNYFSAFIILLCSLLLLNVQGWGQVVWTGTGSNAAWLTTTNWQGGAVPTSTQIAQFTTANSTGNTIGINMNTAGGTQQVGAIEFANTRTAGMTIGNSSTTVNGTFQINGTTVNSVANVILRNNSTQLLTLQNTPTGSGTQTMSVTLGNATDNIINIEGSGGITINSIIVGSTRKLTKAGTGSGILQLTGANTYTGLTTVNGGTLQLNKAGGGTLPSTNDITVTSGTLRISTNQTLNNLTVANGATLTVDAGVTLTINGTYSVAQTSDIGTGTIQINGSLKIEQGGYPGNTGTFSYGASGTLIFNNSSGSYGVGNNPYWPTTNGPVNVTVAGAGGITMNVARTVSGTFQTAAGVVNGNNLTLNGTAQINAGGFFTGSPTYGASSTLVYNSGSVYGNGDEWTGAGANTTPVAGSGVPANVTTNAGSGVSLAGNRGIPGNILINGSLSLNAGDLYLGGNYTYNGTAINNNGKAVFFVNNAAIQTINASGGTAFFDYLIINKTTGTVRISSSPATDVTINTNSGNVLQLFDAGTLDLNGRSLNLNNDGGNIYVSGGTRTITSSVSGGKLNINGYKTVANNAGVGSLQFTGSATVNLNNGFDCGVSSSIRLTTFTGASILQVNAGGYINNNSPIYGAASTLVYNSGGTYGAGLEWAGNAVSAGYQVPAYVTI